MTEPLGRLAGRAAVITGAGSGIGRATAQLFAAEGASLLLNDIAGERLERMAIPLDAATYVGDVSLEHDAAEMLDSCVRMYGRVDIVVANAGVFCDAAILDISTADWDRVMAIDGRGMFLTCKHAVRTMLQAGGGAIVCLSSISGVAGQAEQAAYGPAKFVASGLTKHLAVEWAGRSIRVNAVAPGTIATEGLSSVPAERQAELRRQHPMGRFGQPEEVAQAILFLASDAASFITGVVLPVDGGYLAQ